jgi:hypothetical protein
LDILFAKALADGTSNNGDDTVVVVDDDDDDGWMKCSNTEDNVPAPPMMTARR